MADEHDHGFFNIPRAQGTTYSLVEPKRLEAMERVVEAAKEWKDGGSNEFRLHTTDVSMCRVVCGDGHDSQRFPGPKRNLLQALDSLEQEETP